ncbi:enoyl-CoA hydratase [Bacillus lacus]|uniref:Enoyl-CoA hydratase n=2 Tax=Metabacillus lacus TaxID=1983721 RepID=A0A7X2IX73_9BACI|nr:enoyl-CoA hydratase [Metabacillus lacus]MRX71476.1 enoyl-CoA hydratase [Metabacillus lacus]
MGTVNLTIQERTARLELNRPEVLNAMDENMLRELKKALDEINGSSAEVVIISGSGRGFSAGGDIKTMLSSADEGAFFEIMDVISDIILTLYTMPKLVISAIHGPAAGLGLSFALAADYIAAHEQSVLAMNFIGIGLIPDGGGHYFLEKRAGEARAKQLIWSGEKLDAAGAKHAGLIDEIVQGDMVSAIEDLAGSWLKKPVKAMIETKSIYTAANKERLLDMLAREKEGQYKMRQTLDHQEGISSFIEKRQPVFTGK